MAPIVATSCGPVRGISTDGVSGFLSIPYAEPPVRSLRWQPPVPLQGASCWNGTFDATHFAPPCLQRAEYGHLSSKSSTEDCLKLHVWKADGSSQRLPVFVWLHGGGLLEGSSFAIQSGFEAVGLMPKSLNAIVVGVEYRLGVAGFLALDALAARDMRGGGLVGNYGLLDVLAALRWVQGNIHSFGGDPDRVTVCGQSSGGSLVFALLASPASYGLLHAAISMSGSPRLNSTTREASEYWHQQVVQSTRCAYAAGHRHELGECLLSLNATELLDATPANWHADVFGMGVFDSRFQYAPLLLIDGPNGVLPQPYVSPSGGAPSHLDARVPLIVGATAQEGDFSPSDDVRNMSASVFRDFVRKRLEPTVQPAVIERLLALYVSNSSTFNPQRVYSELVADAVVVCPNFYLASSWQAARRSATGAYGSAGVAGGIDDSPVYAYRASQTLTDPFCVLRKTSWTPSYCPLYSFHASDMFALLQPRQSAAFDYNFSEADREYGAYIRGQLRAVVAADPSGPSGWKACRRPGPPMPDALPPDFFSAELKLPVRSPAVRTNKNEACQLWLSGGWYERIGLIN